MDQAWIDLLNSDYHDYLGTGRDEDRLLNRKWLSGFLVRWDLPPSRRAVEALTDLRTLIRKMADRVMAGRKVARKDWNRLNEVMAGGSVFRRMRSSGERYQLELVPVSPGMESVLAEIAASFAEVFISGDPARIKLCENKDCRWVMYDRSKNRSRRWCESGTACGNIMKVRRHRARRKKA